MSAPTFRPGAGSRKTSRYLHCMPATPAHESPYADVGPLAGRRIVVTRPGAPGDRLSAALEALGAEAPHVALTRIEMVDREGLAWRLAARAHDWVIFTSVNAVRAAADAALVSAPTGGLAEALAGVQVAAVGRVTAESLHDHGIAPVVVPGRFDAEALLEELASRDDVRGRRFLHPASAGAREVLGAGLTAIGAQVETVIAYVSVPDAAGAAALRRLLQHARVDLITFLAPSAVEAYVAAVGAERAIETPAASIGPVTTATLRQHHIPVLVEPDEATASRLVDAIVAHYIR